MNRSAIAALLLLLSGCAASAGSSSGFDDGDEGFDQTRATLQGGVISIQNAVEQPAYVGELAVGADSLWKVLPTAYRQLGLEVNQADTRTRVLGFVNVRPGRVEGNRLSAYLNCGRSLAGPNADTQEVTMNMQTQVASTPTGSEVRIRIDAFARNRAHSGNDIPCRSTGDLEARMVEILKELSE